MNAVSELANIDYTSLPEGTMKSVRKALKGIDEYQTKAVSLVAAEILAALKTLSAIHTILHKVSADSPVKIEETKDGE